MLQMRNTRLYKSLFEQLASGVMIQEEGIALGYIKENGETVVQPSTGANGERFAGIALARNMPPNTLPMVEEGSIEEGSGELTRAPIAGQLLVTLDGVAAEIVATADLVAPGKVFVSGANYQVDAADVGKKARFQYHYVPSTVEARTILGDLPYGGLAANATGTIAVIKQGTVATSFFDASADWSNTTYAKLGAGGRLMPATAATGIQGVVVKNSPSVGNPFLVVELNIG